MKKENKTTNILIVGVGGQGIVLASDILCLAAMYSGLDAKKSEIHGMSQRGGSVFAHVRYADKVYSPVIPEGEADILISLEELETLRWLNYTNKKTKIVFVKHRIMPSQTSIYPEGIESFLKKSFTEVITVDTNKITNELGSQKCINVALVGVISELLDLNKEALKHAIKELVPKGTEELNLKAFELGAKQ